MLVVFDAGTCTLAAASPAVTSAAQCAAPALTWLGDATSAATAYNFTGPSCIYPSKAVCLIPAMLQVACTVEAQLQHLPGPCPLQDSQLGRV